MDAITSFSYKPFVSFVLAAMGFLLTGVLGPVALASHSPLDGIGLFAAGFADGKPALFCIGFFGEYLGRVYDEVRQRPLSIIMMCSGRNHTSQIPRVEFAGGKFRTHKVSARKFYRS